jgi:TonB-linked SusC/RagA family outer membrane protein
MRVTLRRPLLVVLFGLGSLPSGVRDLAAQAGSIAGKVVDQTSGLPLAGARVQASVANYVAYTTQQGTYRIVGVSPGTYSLRILMLGYGSQQKSVTVAAGQSATVDWSLSAVPFTLEEIVTTATGEQLRRELGHSVGRVEAAGLVETAPVSDLTDVLNGRVAGVTVLRNDGVVGGGSRIRIRGLSSVSLSNDPLLYVDGIRVSERGPTFRLDNGGFAPSFFDDINPEEIESIEIVKGPSAATLYGTQAANGVIRVTTKRGKAGPPKWTVYSEDGVLHDPSNYSSIYFAKAAGSDAQCLLLQVAAGQCQIDRLFVRNLLREPDFTPFKDAVRQQYGLQVSGGSENLKYFASAEFEDQGGLLKLPNAEATFRRQFLGVSSLPDDETDPNHQRKVNLRANFTASLGSKADVSFSGAYTNNDLLIPQVGDNGRSLLSSALQGTADPTAATPYGFPVRPGYAVSLRETRKSNHFINSVTASYRPRSWLTSRATVGLDYIGFEDSELERNGEACPICGTSLGFRALNRYTTYKYSVDLGATASFKLTSRIGSKTSIGAQYNKDNVIAALNTGQDLPLGAETYTGAAIKGSIESTTKSVTLGSYLEQQVSLDERLFVTGAIRVDQNAAFGQNARTAYYPKVSAAWTVHETEAGKGTLSQLRFRAAYGQSGLQPGPVDAVQYFNGVTVALFNGTAPGITLGGVGNQSLRPERSREIEGGLDASLFGNRVTVELTAYDKRTTDALVQRPLAGSVGAVASRIENLGVVSNKGFEASILARVIEGRSLQWDLGLEVAGNRNRLVSLAEGTPSPTGFGFRQAVGYPLYGTWWPAMVSFADANHDGIITGSEVVTTDTAVFNGSTLPTRTAALTSTLTLFRNRVRIGAQLEYKGGFRTLDVNTLFSCGLGPRVNCRGLNDASASLDEQARSEAVANYFAFGAFVDDADFVRLRELSVSYTLPRSLTKWMGASGGTVTATGRNLALFTGYRGWDPEGNTLGGTSPDGPVYNFWQPGQPRSFLFRLNLTF